MLTFSPDQRLVLGLVFFFLLFLVLCMAQKQPTLESGSLISTPLANPSATATQTLTFQQAGGDSNSESLGNPNPVTSNNCLNDPRYTKLGYDNPYIFPYHNPMNLNHPASRFRYPNWYRQIQKDRIGHRGFPGFYY